MRQNTEYFPRENSIAIIRITLSAEKQLDVFRQRKEHLRINHGVIQPIVIFIGQLLEGELVEIPAQENRYGRLLQTSALFRRTAYRSGSGYYPAHRNL